MVSPIAAATLSAAQEIGKPQEGQGISPAHPRQRIMRTRMVMAQCGPASRLRQSLYPVYPRPASERTSGGPRRPTTTTTVRRAASTPQSAAALRGPPRCPQRRSSRRGSPSALPGSANRRATPRRDIPLPEENRLRMIIFFRRGRGISGRWSASRPTGRRWTGATRRSGWSSRWSWPSASETCPRPPRSSRRGNHPICLYHSLIF